MQRRGRHDADERLESFARTHEAALLRYAYMLTGSTHEAEDLVQDALLKVLARPTRDIAAVPAYLRKIILNDYRSRCRRRKLLLPVPVLPPAFDDNVVQKAAVWHVLHRLPPRQRAVLVLRYYEDLDDSDIATVLGCRRSTVRSLAARAFAALRTHPDLAPECPAPSAAPRTVKP